MGNKMCRSCRRPVEDRLTRPQRLFRQPSDVDYKKLRKLILSEKLAPCFDAVDDPQLAGDLEECPICFFHYPSLNRSRCCAKGICTECFLQMKPSNTTRLAQCPFCKTSCYAVEYRGARTEEEKGLEQAEEQKVIEAKMRMQSESQIEEQVMHVDQPQSLLELLHPLSDVEGSSSGRGEGRDITELGGTVVQESIEVDGSSDPNTCSTRSPETHERHGELDVDLEEIMVMEAIWQSLQDSRLQRSESSEIRSRSHGENSTGTSFLSGDQRENSSSFSLPEGVAVAIARLAEHNITQQQVSEPDCETSQTDRNLYENFVRDSKSMQPEAGCSSNSGLSIIEQPCMLATELNA